MKKIKTIIDQVAHTDISVLIEGERGTGKELVARAIHCCSLRRTKPFIKVNCTAIPRELLESEFFGFEKGTFASTYARRPGRLELANEGTILLDEVGELDGSLQTKVLQVLQEREFYRLGGENSIGIDTRVIACTEVNLQKVAEAGRFRKDLYDYLNVVDISVPPLRERREEIPSLTKYFLNLYNAHYGRSLVDVSKETEKFFMNYDWPGNIRQLQNAIKRIVVLKDEEQVIQEIPEKRRATSETPVPSSALSEIAEEGGDDLKEVGRRAAKEAERVVIQKMLEETRWNRRETAERLQISYKALLYKIKEYGLDQ